MLLSLSLGFDLFFVLSFILVLFLDATEVLLTDLLVFIDLFVIWLLVFSNPLINGGSLNILL